MTASAVSIARDLIRCPSVTPAEGGALSVLETLLAGAGFAVSRVTFQDTDTPDVENLFATIGTGAPHFVFAGHTDVVPAGSDTDWSHGPFEAEIAGGVLFGVPDYVPALMEYVERYDATLSFNHNLVKVDGENKVATFEVTDGETTSTVEKEFEMMHVCPPQTGLDFIKASPLADEAGWVDVDQATLQHKKYPNIFGLGDGCNTPNAKTAAAVRKQAPVAAVNALAVLDGHELVAEYDGYGSCPLTVERGKIVLAEFGYGGKLMPSFPDWIIDGKRASRRAWFLKERMLPPMYWQGMFRGREYLAQPRMTFEKISAE